METVKKNLYKDKKCFIVGTGGSLNDIDLSLLDNEITIGINLILNKEDFVPDYLCVADTQVIKHNYDTVFSDRMSTGTYVIGNGCKMTGKGNCTNGPGSTCIGVSLDPAFKNIYTLEHWEKSGINEFHRKLENFNREFQNLHEFHKKLEHFDRES